MALAPAEAPAETFHVDPTASEVVARTFKEGIASSFAHDHVIRASKLEGDVRFDPSRPGAGAISIRIPTASLVADEPAMRRKYRVEKTVGEDDRKKIEATMLGADQLDAQKFETITFESTRIQRAGTDRYLIAGVLTVHGTPQPVSFETAAHIQGGALRAAGTFRIAQSSFGFEPYSAAFGAIKNKDEVEIHFSIVATRSDARS